MNKVDLLSKAIKDLMLKEPYYGYFLIQLNKHWRDDIPTAGVSKNGINYQLAINEDFWVNTLTDLHRLGIMKHELNQGSLYSNVYVKRLKLRELPKALSTKYTQ